MASSSILSLLFLIVFLSCTNPSQSAESSKTGLPKKVRVSTLLHPPYIQTVGKPNTYDGYLVDIMRELSQRLKFSYDFVNEADTFGVLVNDKWTGVVKDVTTGKADLGLASVQYTKSRLDAVEYSVPVMHNGIVALRRRQLPSLVTRSLFFCLEPFGAGVWVCLIFVLLLTTALLTLNATRNPRERAQRMSRGELSSDPNVSEEPLSLREHLSQTAWYVLSTAALQSAPRQPMSVTGRVLSLTWWVFAGMTLCTYIAALLMGIVVARGFPAPSFTTISELAVQSKSQGYRVFFVPPGLGELFKNHTDKSFQQMYALAKQSEDYLKDDASRGDRNTRPWANQLLKTSDKNIVIIGSETGRMLLKFLECGTVVATEFVDDRYMSLVFPRNATKLRVEVNKVLLTLLEEGTIRVLQHKWQLLGSGKCNKGFDVDDPSWIYRQADATESVIAASEALAQLLHNSVPIRFGTFSGILLLYIFGLVISSIALAADLYIYSRIERHKRGNQVLTNRGGQRRISDTPEFENFNEL